MSNEPFQNGYEQNVSSVFQKSVIELFERHLKAGSAYAPAAASVLTEVIKSSEEETIMGLEVQLKQAADAILKTAPMTAFVSLKASTELFLRFVIRTSLEFSDFEECKRRLIERGEYFKGRTEASRDKIAQVGERFIQDGSVILTHGNSRVVAAVFERAAKTKRFRVYVTESRPDGSGYSFAERLLSAGVSVTIILDSSVGFIMDQVDSVLVGAEGVAENGGIVNRIGSLQVALVASSYNKPVFVAVESYKFSRIYPLRQRDLPCSDKYKEPWHPLLPEVTVSKGIQFENPASDFTPPSLISLLFTDLGVLTPAAVSDELIRLYQ
ncbi:hypothetical protein GAYE_SCF00G1814 [Galdieria yellowstonensis]|uniref:Translation initiation factor eIF2B subunit alpha n=1 Tax=Galdieria yellowstonensis TaxID=3028027 RepID=A0AAV9I9J2_9RHOD|nr:hypothetical protein GAYE_SCF00G1814 [Galdieria yellowstonensis]